MKCKLLTGVCLFIALASCVSQASTIANVGVDESGNGFITTPSTVTVLTGLVITDNTTSTTGSKLGYGLPFVVTPGDVVLTEPGTTEPADSDLIRFIPPPPTFPGPVGSVLLFYSELPAAGEIAQAADLGVPPASPTAKVFVETGLFGAPYSEAGPNGLLYAPGPTDPGGSSNASLTYIFTSDPAGTPLPASAWAGLVLIAGFGAWRIVRRRRHGALRI